MSTKISGSKYAAMYGPTTGDKVRLADTSLVIEVEKDYTTYGDEVKFGGGKTIRDGMGQSSKNLQQRRRSGSGNYQCIDRRLHRNRKSRHRY